MSARVSQNTDIVFVPCLGFPESPYSQYSPQSLPQTHLQPQGVGENAASQMNQLAYAANNAAAVAANNAAAAAQGSYNFALAPSGFSSQGSSPSAGPGGTKIQIRLSGHYDIMALTSTTPYAWALFGNAASKTPAQIVREVPPVQQVDASGGATYYLVTAEAPAFMLTNWSTTSNVPVTVVIESADGNELARVGSAGSFTYTDSSADVAQQQGAVASPPDEGVTRSGGRSTGTRSPSTHDHETHAHGGHTHAHAHSGLQVNSPPSLTVRTSTTTSPATEHGVPGVGSHHHHSHHHHMSQHAHQHHHTQQPHDVADPTGTNTYGYPPAASQLQVPPQTASQTTSPFGAYGPQSTTNTNDTMLHAYRTSNNTFAHSTTPHHHQYHQQQRSPTALRSPLHHAGLGAWASYGGLDGRVGGIGGSGYAAAAAATHHHGHTSITRPSLTPSLPMPSGGPPALVRTTSLPQGGGGPGGMGGGLGGAGGVYSPFGSHHKAQLHIQGDLEDMVVNWTSEEWENARRIVIFKKSQSGSRLTATFRAVPVNERPPNSICISCIWWEEKQECFVTSVDTIHLLEQLVAAPNRFTVEEKNRIRRNLEGFKPLTVSKAKSDSENFFKVIMGFGNPKPRNIEKDVKVFQWKVLSSALKKIISKYSASPSSTMPQSTQYQQHQHHPQHHPSLLTPVSVSSNYGLPPTPTTATDPSVTGYLGSAGLAGGHHTGSLSESIPSPRSLTGGLHSSWASAYPSGRGDAHVSGGNNNNHSSISSSSSTNNNNSRALSPTAGLLKTTSPSRLSGLPSAYDTRASQAVGHYGLASQQQQGSAHHHQQHQHHAGLSAQQQGGSGGHATAAAATGRWDYSVNAISDTTGAYGGGARGGGGYDYGAYGDGASQRA